MSSGSDPASVLAALERAQDAFEMVGRGGTEFEDGISADADWKTQLTKACRLLEVVNTLHAQDGYYTAVIEVCFGVIERSIEAYALSMTNDTLQDFQDHQFSYERAHQIGLFERQTAEEMKDLYSENRIESYPTYRLFHHRSYRTDGISTAPRRRIREFSKEADF